MPLTIRFLSCMLKSLSEGRPLLLGSKAGLRRARFELATPGEAGADFAKTLRYAVHLLSNLSRMYLMPAWKPARSFWFDYSQPISSFPAEVFEPPPRVK